MALSKSLVYCKFYHFKCTWGKVEVTECSCYVTYKLQNQFTLYSCLNVKELIARNYRNIWSLSDYNWTGTHNHLVHKLTVNHLSKLARTGQTVCGFESSCSHLMGWSVTWNVVNFKKTWTCQNTCYFANLSYDKVDIFLQQVK